MSRKSRAAEFLQEAYNITVTGRNVFVTDAMKDYAIEKVSKIERFTNRIINVLVKMDVQKIQHLVDIIIQVDNTKIKGHAVTDNIYASIDKAVDKIEAQLQRYKTKIQDHQAKGVAAIDLNVNVLRATENEEVYAINDEIEDENRRRLLDRFQPHKVVKKESCPLKILTDGEAIMKLELSEEEFLVYQSEETAKIRVMYRREDGDFGVIEVKEGS